MTVRELRTSDLEPLYNLYLNLARRMPPHPLVGPQQFAAELTTTRYQEDELWGLDDHRVLVAEVAGDGVAFAHASFLSQDARYSSGKAGEGVVRFLFSSPERSDALRAALRPIIEEARSRECPNFRALAFGGPLFHNCGASGLTNAWPWVGRALVQEGFETEGFSALGMACRLENPRRVRLFEGAEFREDWTTRIGMRDDTEGGLHIVVGEDRAAETMWHFGEKYVAGAEHDHAHLFWLGTNDPYQGKGLGRAILRESLARADERGARTSDLRCNVNNFYAHSLYRAEGYVPVDLLWSFRLRR